MAKPLTNKEVNARPLGNGMVTKEEKNSAGYKAFAKKSDAAAKALSSKRQGTSNGYMSKSKTGFYKRGEHGSLQT